METPDQTGQQVTPPAQPGTSPDGTAQPTSQTTTPTPTPTPTTTPAPQPPDVPPEIRAAYPGIDTREKYERFLRDGPAIFDGALKQISDDEAAKEAQRLQNKQYRARKAAKNELLQFAQEHKAATGEDLDLLDIVLMMKLDEQQGASPGIKPEEIDSKIANRVAYETFWNDPKHADIAADAEAKELTHFYVTQKKMKPSEAVTKVRQLLKKEPPKPPGGSGQRQELSPWLEIEGSPESPEPRPVSRLTKAREYLKQQASKPAEQQSSADMWAIWKS